MYKKSLVIFTILIMFAYEPSSAQDSELNQVGTSMANFLKIGVGARAVSMGGAVVAISNDVSSTFWNPGGLAFTNNEMMFQVTNWIADTRHYFFAASYGMGDLGNLGLSVISFNSGDIQETTLYEPEGTGRNFSAGNLCAGLTFSKKFTDRFSAGVTVKYISETLDRSSASTVAIDIGSIFITNFLNNMRIGISLSNLGGRMQLDGSDLTVQYLPENGTKYTSSQLRTESWDIPLLFRFGLATNAIETEDYRFLISTEIIDSRDYEYQTVFGGEFNYSNIISLRAGYKMNFDEADLSFGVGLNIEKISGINLNVDYSYNDYGILNTIHSVSLLFAY
jgi:hypothetical protein